MRRLIYLVVALVAVLLLVAVGVYAIRSRSGRAPAARADAAPSHTMPDTSAATRDRGTAWNSARAHHDRSAPAAADWRQNGRRHA